MSGFSFWREKESSRSYTRTKPCRFCQEAVHPHNQRTDVCTKPKCVSLSSKAYSDWTEDDLLYVKDKNVTEWFTIKKEKDRIESERADTEFKQEQMKEIRALELQREQHEKQILQQRKDMKATHEARLHEMEEEKQRKILALKDSVNDSRKQHSKEMEELEHEYQEQLHQKEKEITKLREEREKIESDYKTHYEQQHRQLSERSTDMKMKANQDWDDLNKRMKERSSVMEAKIAEDQAEFKKKLELDRQVLKQKAEEAFTSRITTQLEMEKPDGSRLKLSETTQGVVSQITADLGLSSDLEKRETESNSSFQ